MQAGNKLPACKLMSWNREVKNKWQRVKTTMKY